MLPVWIIYSVSRDWRRKYCRSHAQATTVVVDDHEKTHNATRRGAAEAAEVASTSASASPTVCTTMLSVSARLCANVAPSAPRVVSARSAQRRPSGLGTSCFRSRCLRALPLSRRARAHTLDVKQLSIGLERGSVSCLSLSPERQPALLHNKNRFQIVSLVHPPSSTDLRY